MRRCKSLYICFLGAVFMMSLYNFVALSIVQPPAPALGAQSDPLGRELQAANLDEVDSSHSRDVFELELDADNPHVFQQTNGGVQFSDLSEELEEVEALPVKSPDIFWPSEVEIALPAGTRGDAVESCRQFRQKVEELGLNRTEPGTWTHCGRANNAHAVRNDGQRLCIRHRKPHHYYVAGDALSYQLAEMMELSGVPCVRLDRVESSEPKWAQADLSALNWADGDIVALIQWVPANRRLPLHRRILNALLNKKTVRWTDVEHEQPKDKLELAQWSDLIVFDFLTAQYDRIASLQDEADKQNNPKLLHDHVRNMAADEEGTLWIYDNEAGLLDAYILLYQATPDDNHLRFQRFHQEMLNTICVFRKPTVHAISILYQRDEPVEYLLSRTRETEPLLDAIPVWDDVRLHYLRAHFKERLAALIGHFKWCADTETEPSAHYAP